MREEGAHCFEALRSTGHAGPPGSLRLLSHEPPGKCCWSPRSLLSHSASLVQSLKQWDGRGRFCHLDARAWNPPVCAGLLASSPLRCLRSPRNVLSWTVAAFSLWLRVLGTTSQSFHPFYCGWTFRSLLVWCCGEQFGALFLVLKTRQCTPWSSQLPSPTQGGHGASEPPALAACAMGGSVSSA